MVEQGGNIPTRKGPITVVEVRRILDLGRLLLSVLTPEELDTLARLLKDNTTSSQSSSDE